jgi:hypothetical protein
MKLSSVAIVASMIGFGFSIDSPALAQQADPLKKPAARAAKQNRPVEPAQHAYRYAAPRGPLYNGQDYLGDDPDPHIRAYIIKDLGMRYGGAY